MKKIISVLVVILILTTLCSLCSCGHDSGKLIGSFRVINKEKAYNHNDSDYGYVTLVACHNEKDSLKTLISAEELFLNIKLGDIVLVGRDKYGARTIKKRVKRFEVGYCTIVERMSRQGTCAIKALARGGDTITIYQVPEDFWFKSSINDSIFVKKNRDNNKPLYYIKFN